MRKINISKETAVPNGAEIIPDTIYMVDIGLSKMEIYMSNSAGDSLKRVINEQDVQALIDLALAGVKGIDVVDTIEDRDALNPTGNVQVIVVDASGDPGVTSGSATYVFRDSTSTWIKISESESMDLVLNWANIQGRPSSTPAQIDNAVTASHNHANKSQLDKIGQDGEGDMTYNGQKVANTYMNTAW